MTDRVHVKMELDVFIDDEDAIRQSAFERMKAAWRSDDAFPFDGPSEVPIGHAVQSLLADSVPLELTGCRRSRLVMETEEQEGGSSSEDTNDSDEGSDEGSDESGNSGGGSDADDARDRDDTDGSKDDRGDSKEASDDTGGQRNSSKEASGSSADAKSNDDSDRDSAGDK